MEDFDLPMGADSQSVGLSPHRAPPNIGPLAGFGVFILLSRFLADYAPALGQTTAEPQSIGSTKTV